MRLISRILVCSIVACLVITSSQAQRTNAAKNTTTTTTPKFKPPKLYTSINSFKDSSFVTADQAADAIAMPLKIVDDKKNVYSISSYQFMYKKRGVTEDEQTGKLSPTTTISADRFKQTPLPEVWIRTIQSQVKSGEELYFFDVIAKDAQGRVLLASDLKLFVK
ncbi:MAG: hypothetical protein U0T68_13490 [Ferruginibacter sp.]